jgi:hypothetical protein
MRASARGARSAAAAIVMAARNIVDNITLRFDNNTRRI